MTLLTKAIVYILVLGLIVSLIALLPSVQEVPLPASFSVSLQLIFGYLFAWGSVFSCLYVLISCALLMLALEVVIWVVKTIVWIVGLVVRFVG